MPASWPSRYLEELVAAIKNKECVVFLGAGPSTEVGYPNAGELYTLLADICRDVGRYTSEALAEIEGLAEEDGPSLIEWLHRALPGLWIERLRRIFPDRTPGHMHSPVHEVLLDIGFAGYVTTNYDMCVEDAVYYRRQHLGIVEEPDVKSYPEFDLGIGHKSSRQFIYHIHGSAQDLSHFVLTPSQYRRAYSGKSQLPRLLTELFSTYVVLFIGFSFSDYEIRRILEELGHVYRDEQAWASAKVRYAILSKEENDLCTSIREQIYFDTRKTRPVYYTAYDTGEQGQYGRPAKDHGGLLALLQQLRRAASGVV